MPGSPPHQSPNLYFYYVFSMNSTSPMGPCRGWFACRNRDQPFLPHGAGKGQAPYKPYVQPGPVQPLCSTCGSTLSWHFAKRSLPRLAHRRGKKNPEWPRPTNWQWVFACHHSAKLAIFAASSSLSQRKCPQAHFTFLHLVIVIGNVSGFGICYLFLLHVDRLIYSKPLLPFLT